MSAYGSRKRTALEPAERQSRAERLRAEFAWQRRGAFVVFLEGCGYRPLEAGLRASAAADAQVLALARAQAQAQAAAAAAGAGAGNGAGAGTGAGAGAGAAGRKGESGGDSEGTDQGEGESAALVPLGIPATVTDAPTRAGREAAHRRSLLFANADLTRLVASFL